MGKLVERVARRGTQDFVGVPGFDSGALRYETREVYRAGLDRQVALEGRWESRRSRPGCAPGLGEVGMTVHRVGKLGNVAGSQLVGRQSSIDG